MNRPKWTYSDPERYGYEETHPETLRRIADFERERMSYGIGASVGSVVTRPESSKEKTEIPADTEGLD